MRFDAYSVVLLSLFITLTTAAYNVKYPESNNVFINGNELYDRHKCETCCRVMFVSDNDFGDGQKYTMDMEFEFENQVRVATSSWEQTILLKPINIERSLQKFELNSYKMMTVFAIPKRTHDIRGGIKIGSRLIIWKKKAPLDVGTNNQRFVYHHPYSFSNYKNQFKYPKHFQAPFYTADDVCYEAALDKQIWTGNNQVNRPNEITRGYEYGYHEYQIKLAKCEADNIKQKFSLVFV
jgi:galactose-inhibitable lectin light subunit